MSLHSEADFAACQDPAGCASVALVVTPRSKDLGEFSVRRVLPAEQQRAR